MQYLGKSGTTEITVLECSKEKVKSTEYMVHGRPVPIVPILI